VFVPQKIYHILLHCNIFETFDYAGVAQLVEQLIRNQQAGGSNPPVGSTFLRVFAIYSGNPSYFLPFTTGIFQIAITLIERK
jgi:hypothetical protein